jgi:hypothetical protein
MKSERGEKGRGGRGGEGTEQGEGRHEECCVRPHYAMSMRRDTGARVWCGATDQNRCLVAVIACVMRHVPLSRPRPRPQFQFQFPSVLPDVTDRRREGTRKKIIGVPIRKSLIISSPIRSATPATTTTTTTIRVRDEQRWTWHESISDRGTRRRRKRSRWRRR